MTVWEESMSLLSEVEGKIILACAEVRKVKNRAVQTQMERGRCLTDGEHKTD